MSSHPVRFLDIMQYFCKARMMLVACKNLDGKFSMGFNKIVSV
jgi:hypothetical protein